MDIKLGRLRLTQEQFERTRSLNSDEIRGFSQDSEGNVTVVTTREMTQEETDSLKASLEGLSKDALPKSAKELRLEELKGKPVLTIQELTEIVKGLI